MDKSLLVKLLGFPATLLHGDPLVLDRWLWLRARLPITGAGERLLDVGCGSGAFSIGAALRGYRPLGLSWDVRNQEVASVRARMCGAAAAKFEVLDIRELDKREDLKEQFDVVINCENIEHILDDLKLMRSIAACLRPGGRLLLTTPYMRFHPMSPGDHGPYSLTEDGGHVRRGYNKSMLQELCDLSGLIVEETSFCSGVISQRICTLQRRLIPIHPMMAWTVTLPMRIIPPLLDRHLTAASSSTHYSICLEAYKPRFGHRRASHN